MSYYKLPSGRLVDLLNSDDRNSISLTELKTLSVIMKTDMKPIETPTEEEWMAHVEAMTMKKKSFWRFFGL